MDSDNKAFIFTSIEPKVEIDTRMHHVCDICGKSFTTSSNLHHHVRSIHKAPAPIAPGNIRCPLCTEQFVTHYELHSHLTSAHKVTIETEHHAFASLEEFQNWKSRIEKATSSQFVKSRGKSVYKGVESVKFFCHRSGSYVSKTQNRKRSLKMVGSNKVGHNCPAKISTVQVVEGCIEVEYVKTHVGHLQDIARVQLTNSERQIIADKIRQNFTVDEILDDIRTCATLQKLERLHLLTRRDIHNIARDFKVQRDKPNAVYTSKTTSVDEWVQEMEKKIQNPVHVYKRRGEILASTPELGASDFLLVIMTEVQKEILTKHNDIIIFDGIPGTNAGEDFKFTTIFTVDDKREVFPCAFTFSNGQDEPLLKAALTSIKRALGALNLSPSALVGDDTECFVNAWQTVFGFQGQRFLSDWHVRRMWKKNLSLVKGDVSAKKTVQEKLLSVLEQTDKDVFHWMLDELLTQLKEGTCTKAFGDYLYNHYAKRSEMWAYCYRFFDDVNISPSLEQLHRIIKYKQHEGKKMICLDKSVHSLMTYVRDKQMNRLSCINKAKIPRKLRLLRRQHQLSLNLSSGAAIPCDDNSWTVLSSSQIGDFHHVQYSGPCQESCSLYCNDCKACYHNFTCDCKDNGILGQMCKHIHLVCRVKNSPPEAEIQTYEKGSSKILETDSKLQLTHNTTTVEVRDGVQVYYITVSEAPSTDTFRKQAIQEGQSLLEEHFGSAKSVQEVNTRLQSFKNYVQSYEAGKTKFEVDDQVKYFDNGFIYINS